MLSDASKSLLEIFVDAKANRWCTRIPCTTCGCRELRSALELLETDDILKSLGDFSAEDVVSNSDTIRAVLTWLRYARWVATPSDFDVIKGSEVWKIIVSDYNEHQLRSASDFL
jgi:hypothetical protein